MQENLYVNLIALAISHSDAQWKAFRKNRFECDMVWTQWHANAIPWTTASVMYTESVLCVKSNPQCSWPGCLTWREGEVARSTVASSPGLLPVRGGAFLEILPSECFINDPYDRLICISLSKLWDANHLQKMSAVLTPERSNASDRPPWGEHELRRTFALSFFPVCTVKAWPSLQKHILF